MKKYAYYFHFFLDNLCIDMQQSLDKDRFSRLQSLIGRLARVKKPDYLDDVLTEIGGLALRLWKEEDSQLDHIDMALSFKNNSEYSRYFVEQNFDSRLKKKMREICVKNDIPKIRGVHVFRKNFKRSPKK